MRWCFLFTLILIVSCATKAPVRDLASIEEVFGTFDPKKSLVQIFPALEKDERNSHYLYVQLKDDKNRFIDAKKEEFVMKSRNGKFIKYNFERINVGKYYLSIENGENIESHEIDLHVQGKVVKEQFRLQMRRPHKSQTKIKMLKNNNHRITFELRLADSKNRAVNAPDKPEIVIDGQGIVEDMQLIRDGIWKFTIHYPDENQIMYVSVRSMGITFQNLFRYQHVEK